MNIQEAKEHLAMYVCKLPLSLPLSHEQTNKRTNTHTHTPHEHSLSPSLTRTHSLSPVGELHHEVEDGKHHEKVEEGVAVGHTLLFIISVVQFPLSLLILASLLFLRLFLVIWNIITADPWTLYANTYSKQKEGENKGVTLTGKIHTFTLQQCWLFKAGGVWEEKGVAINTQWDLFCVLVGLTSSSFFEPRNFFRWLEDDSLKLQWGNMLSQLIFQLTHTNKAQRGAWLTTCSQQ